MGIEQCFHNRGVPDEVIQAQTQPGFRKVSTARTAERPVDAAEYLKIASIVREPQKCSRTSVTLSNS